MQTAKNARPPLVQDMVDMLLSKFESLPKRDRQVMVIAILESAAWISAMESTSHARRRGSGKAGAEERIQDYRDLFETNIRRDLNEMFGDSES